MKDKPKSQSKNGSKRKFLQLCCMGCINRNNKNDDCNNTDMDKSQLTKDKNYITYNDSESITKLSSNAEYSRSTKPLPDIPNLGKHAKRKTPLIPDLLSIFNLPYYWGQMDRYEAEAELKDLDDGAFLLRDSTQEEFLFSVSFNRFGRTIHARVDYFHGRYSFDLNYGVAQSIPLLLSNFQSTNSCMFYHPLCCKPRPRRQPFSLQRLCLGTICSYLRYYEDIYELDVPTSLVRRLDFSNFKVPMLYCNFYNESLLTNTTSTM